MPIQQHALPQDVTGYKFRLVGDMTLKQFLMLAVNIIICVLIYGSPLPFFFRIPLAAIFLLLGIGLAFVPVQGRPLDQWLVAFFKSIYSPTQYRWEDRAKSISPTSATPTSTQAPISAPINPVTQPTPAPIPVPPGSVPITASPVPPANSTAPSTPTVTPQPSPVIPPPITPITPSTPVPQTPIAPPISTPPNQIPPIAKPQPNIAPPSNPLSNLPIPFTPTTPNTIVGLTLDSQNKIVDGVLIEIKTNGLTVRATKSNKLGQFMFARPLENGLYQISAEKTDLTFDTYSLNLHGQIVNPLKIQTKS